MEKFSVLHGIALPLDRANVDTDAILPKQFLKSIHRTGFGPSLFDDWRYLDPYREGEDNSLRRVNPELVLNHPGYAGASILLAGENFGCGSSREHAAWALKDYGIRVILSSSFADIFFSNCFKNGLLPIQLPQDVMQHLFEIVTNVPGSMLTVDLPKQVVGVFGDKGYTFQIDGFRKHCLLNGFDEVGLTLLQANEIKAYENTRRAERPWLFR